MTRRASKPPVPDWQDCVWRLLHRPGIAPDDAATLRKWLGWRALPRSYGPRLQAIAERTDAAADAAQPLGVARENPCNEHGFCSKVEA